MVGVMSDWTRLVNCFFTQQLIIGDTLAMTTPCIIFNSQIHSLLSCSSHTRGALWTRTKPPWSIYSTCIQKITKSLKKLQYFFNPLITLMLKDPMTKNRMVLTTQTDWKGFMLRVFKQHACSVLSVYQIWPCRTPSLSWQIFNWLWGF